MDIERAKELLTALSDGVNPITGEVLPEDDSCNQVEVVRAFNIILRCLDDEIKKSCKKLPENSGKPWTAQNDEDLCRMFDEGIPCKAICDQMGRTKGSIAARLVRLGKIAQRDELNTR